MNKPVAFCKLAAVLRSCGFAQEQVPDAHVLFRHAPSGAVLMLSPAQKTISVAYLRAAARTLDENGILTRDEFERRLYSSKWRGAADPAESHSPTH